MWNRNLLLSTIIVSSFAAVAPTAQAAVQVYIDTPPPAVRYEVVPAPRKGYVGAPGYWNWNNHRHVWARGHWERQRVGYYYHPNRWTQNEGRWTREGGRWDRNAPMGDRDHDGVPNIYDRQPDNPRRQ